MDVIEQLMAETDIEKLREQALTHLKILFEGYKNAAYKSEIYEFIISNMDLSVDFDYCETPKVSIVIPVKNEFLLTAFLLKSIKENTKDIPYEIIIADDNSEDETQNLEAHFKNVKRIVNNSGHSGFIYNVNNAVSKARGEYIFLMNNDMIALDGYLKELLTVIESDKNIGIAGCKNLNIDGTVKETGLKMFKEGIVMFWGKDKPMDYMDDKLYLECDYCSGCSILFRKDVWEKAGGLDKNLAPAYFEDSDFAFNLKYNFGLKSVCVPRAKIYHFRGISYNNANIKNQYYYKNREYFLGKWGKYLTDSCDDFA